MCNQYYYKYVNTIYKFPITFFWAGKSYLKLDAPDHSLSSALCNIYVRWF